MQKIEPRTLQGMTDYLPDEMALRRHVKETWIKIFQKYGYGELETPAIEYADVLLGSYGEEEKLIYKFKDLGDREVALRYDQTVPLARVMTQHEARLTFPFKRYEINRVWRADSARKGRKREFYQCDIDIIGSDDVMAESEIIAVLHEGFTALGLSDHQIYINHRKAVNGFLRTLDLPEKAHIDVLRSIDKVDKIGMKGVEEELKTRGISAKAIPAILNFLEKDDEKVESALGNLSKMVKGDNEGENGVSELKKLVQYLAHYNIPQKNYRLKPSLVRGLDYYTGIVFEVKLPSFGNASLAGGGRYSELCSRFSDKKLSGTGVGIGFEPICMAIKELNLGPKNTAPAAVLVTIFNEELVGKSIETAQFLRNKGIKTMVYPESDAKLGKQFKYADRLAIPYIVVIGPDEVAEGKVVVKNMADGSQKTMRMDVIPDRIVSPQATES
ncbi:histidine--tRNA ligase [Candidatus Peregrinibacteria bacterium]|nr:histidine--tRNA ligase [Candidatus Peregrinibacteria bacterium]